MGQKYSILPSNLASEVAAAQAKLPDVDISIKRIAEYKREVSQHVGELVVLNNFGERSLAPKVVTIDSVWPNFFVVSWPCYAPDGRFRCNLRESFLWVDLYTRTITLNYLSNDDI